MKIPDYPGTDADFADQGIMPERETPDPDIKPFHVYFRRLWLRLILCEPEERAELTCSGSINSERLLRYEFTYEQTPCWTCKGSGWSNPSLAAFPCRHCRGKGYIKSNKP